MKRATSAALLVFAFFCHKYDIQKVSKFKEVSVVGWITGDEKLLAVRPEEIRQIAMDELTRSDRFKYDPADESAFSARVSILSVGEEDSSRETTADREIYSVAMELTLKRTLEGKHDEYRAEGKGSVRSSDAGAGVAELKSLMKEAIVQAVRRIETQAGLDTEPDGKLIDILKKDDIFARQYAIQILGERRSKEAVPALLGLLKGKDDRLNRRIVGALTLIKDERAVPDLIDLASGENDVYKIEIIYAFEEIGGEEAKAYLFTLSTGHQSARIRQAAAEALDGLSGSGEKSGSAEHASAAGETEKKEEGK